MRRTYINTKARARPTPSGLRAARPVGARHPEYWISIHERAAHRFLRFRRHRITAETLGGTLLTQFEGLGFNKTTLPFINTPDKARVTVDYINHLADSPGPRPIDVQHHTSTTEVRGILRGVKALFMEPVRQLYRAIEASWG